LRGNSFRDTSFERKSIRDASCDGNGFRRDVSDAHLDSNAVIVSKPNKVPQLSAREIEVLLAWLAADSKDDAAARLYIAATTVNTHLTRIRAKYSACDRPARTKSSLFARAVQDGHTRLDEW
jgi:DNA-binding CsgD family transcriptional regulator